MSYDENIKYYRKYNVFDFRNENNFYFNFQIIEYEEYNFQLEYRILTIGGYLKFIGIIALIVKR